MTPRVNSVTPPPTNVTGLYTDSPALCMTAFWGDLLSIINWVAVLELNVIVSSPINTDPVLSHPIVEKTFILSSVLAVPVNVVSRRVLVETLKSPLTVSGASTIL